eukprot:Clim_evm15s139 gene=Clim_evmTU15s139
MTESNGTETVNKKSHGYRFKQQKLPAWQPVLTPRTVIPIFFLLGIIFLPIGIGMLVSSNDVVERVIEYTNCTPTGSDTPCSETISGNPTATCTCDADQLSFTLDSDINEEVYVYYQLTNFYQNHRRYVRSRDYSQLKGDDIAIGALNSDCDPIRDVTLDNGTLANYAPCGLIGDSLFNDTFTMSGPNGAAVTLAANDIAWQSDLDELFSNPTTFDGTVPPPAYNDVPIVDLDHGSGTGYENEDFIVWMRVAALPTFRKLWRRIPDGLAAGTYTITMDYTFDSTAYSGEKSVIVSTTSWIGGKSDYLGILYMVTGSILILMGAGLAIHNAVRPRKLADHRYLKWNPK